LLQVSLHFFQTFFLEHDFSFFLHQFVFFLSRHWQVHLQFSMAGNSGLLQFPRFFCVLQEESSQMLTHCSGDGGGLGVAGHLPQVSLQFSPTFC